MNCIVIDDEDFSRKILVSYISMIEDLKLIGEYNDPVAALPHVNDKVDLIFLDMEMPRMTGMEFLDSMKNLPQVIITTSRPEYAADAFSYSVTDYLVKPLQFPRFTKAVQRAKDSMDTHQLNNLPESNDVYVRTDNKIVKVDLNEVLFVEALADYVVFHLVSDKLIVHATMKNLEQKLAPHDFIRVHRSFIVNTAKISAIQDLQVVMGNKTVPIGGSYKDGFLKKLNFLL